MKKVEIAEKIDSKLGLRGIQFLVARAINFSLANPGSLLSLNLYEHEDHVFLKAQFEVFEITPVEKTTEELQAMGYTIGKIDLPKPPSPSPPSS